MIQAMCLSTSGARIFDTGIVKRFLAVKALSWCSPPDSPERRNIQNSTFEERNKQVVFEPIDRFGIVAAMSSNQIIGINGRLPWRIPKDRKAFKTLTENTILIIGRRTYEENPLRRHINHAFATVIMSTSLDANFDDSKLRVARSFSEALHIARLLMEEQSVHADSGRISCWVAGGERVYHEALLHPNAAELHLTTIESEINTLPNQEFAKFPAKYRWDSKFSELSRQEDVDGGLRFTRCIFRRLAGRR